MWSKLQACCASTFGLAVIGAGLLWAALPPLDLWPLAWLAPVCWVLLIRRPQLPGRRPYWALWLAGFLFWMAAVHWVRLAHWTAYFGWVAASFYLALYIPVFVGLSRVAVHRFRVPVILAAPVVWTGLELARGHLLTGFTMASLGHTQYRWIDLIQLSDLAGAYGVGFVVMFVAACLGQMIRGQQTPAAVWPVVPAAAIVGAALLYGYLRAPAEDSPPQTRIALIQGSVDTEIKFDPQKRQLVFEQYLLLSQEAVEKSKPAGVDLIVWPETMFRDTLVTFDDVPPMPDAFDGTEKQFNDVFRAYANRVPDSMKWMALSLDASMILGVDRHHYGSEEMRLNSAAFVERKGTVSDRYYYEVSDRYYDKIHLVMFGEYVPLVRHFPSLQRITPVRFSVSHGSRWVVFELDNGLRIAPSICYETVIPHVIRRQVNSLKEQGTEPDVLVNLTNDGWFWGSSELDMHLACGVFRAVECRKPLLIAANTGISAWIDGSGRIIKRGPRRHKDPQLQTGGALSAAQRQRRSLWSEQYGAWPKGTATILAVAGRDGRNSPYLRYGDWPAGICLAACVLLGLAAAWERIAGRSQRS